MFINKIVLWLVQYVVLCRFHIRVVSYHSLVQIRSNSDKRDIHFTPAAILTAASFCLCIRKLRGKCTDRWREVNELDFIRRSRRS